jgi:hypothetical protein
MSSIYNSAFVLLTRRLKNHCSEGGILHPCSYKNQPRFEAEGLDQLPNISFLSIDIEEDVMPVLGDANSIPLTCIQDARFLLSFNKEYSTHSEDGESFLGLMDWIPRFHDAIELNENLLLDTHLSQSVIEPLLVSVEGTEIQEVSWTIEFSVKLKIKPYNRGTRRTGTVISGEAFPGTFPLVLS